MLSGRRKYLLSLHSSLNGVVYEGLKLKLLLELEWLLEDWQVIVVFEYLRTLVLFSQNEWLAGWNFYVESDLFLQKALELFLDLCIFIVRKVGRQLVYLRV